MMTNCTNAVPDCSTHFEEIGYFFVFTPICVIGIIFNCLSLFVFGQNQFSSKMTPSILPYLTGMALVDLMSCFIALPVAFIRCTPATTYNAQYFYNFYEKYIYYPFGGTFLTTSVWITLIFTMDRFFFVTSNNGERINRSNMRSAVKAKCICVFAFVVAFCMFIPTIFFYEDIQGNKKLVESEFGMSLGYEIYSWIRMFLTKIIPILLVASTNVALVRVIFMKSKTLKAVIFPTAVYTKRVKAQHRMTAMLLSISFTFVFCHAMKPLLNSRVFSTLFGPCSTKTTEYGQLRVVIVSLEMISCASNFVYFSIFHPYFLQTLKLSSKCNSIKIRPLFSSTNLDASRNGTKITNGKSKKCYAI